MNNDTHRTQHPVQDERPLRTGAPAWGPPVLAALAPPTLRGAVLELGPVGSGKNTPLNPLAVVTSNKTDLLPGSLDDGRVL